MNPTLTDVNERHRRLRDLVDRATELPETEWSSFFDIEYPTDPDLRTEAIHLLANGKAARAKHFLELSPSTIATPPRGVADQERTPSLGEPSKLGKYEIVERFSERSGQAAAYKAFDPDLRRHVVLKSYHAGHPGAPDETEEGRALARVQSPYVAGCHGVERISGEAFLVVEFIPGRNLAQVQRDQRLSVEQIVRIVALLAEGVSAVHARGLIHRDIKPANVILHDDGKPRLVDFGLAAHLGSPRLREIGGTPQYMAPEQARVESDRIDQRADIFGLGALLYTLLTGHAPHEGARLTEILEHAKRGDILPPRQRDPEIPATVEAVCLKALSAAPENRHTTALEFATALRQAIAPTPVLGPPSTAKTARRHWLVPAATLACGVIVLAFWFWPKVAKPLADRAVPSSSATPTGPIQAEITVKHFKELGDGRRVMPHGTVSETSLASDPLPLKDMVRVHVSLSRPAFGYLIALNPDGRDQLCTSVGTLSPRSPREEFDFPEDASDYFRLSDGVGLQAFVVVISDQPLPE